MTFYSFISGMTEAELSAYAESCETTPHYLLNHLRYAKKVPRKALWARLWKNSGGKLKEKDLLAHFYKQAA